MRISDPRLRGDLGEFLSRATCNVTPVGTTMLVVDVPGADEGIEERLDLFMAAWRGLHPNIEAELIPGRRKPGGETP